MQQQCWWERRLGTTVGKKESCGFLLTAVCLPLQTFIYLCLVLFVRLHKTLGSSADFPPTELEQGMLELFAGTDQNEP